jgi:phosphoglycolate phosphatase
MAAKDGVIGGSRMVNGDRPAALHAPGTLPTHRLLTNVTFPTATLVQMPPRGGYGGAMREFLLLFDLDGTLVDTLPDLTNALNEALRERGYAALAPAEVRPMIGDGMAMLLARGFAARGGSHLEAEAMHPRFIEIYEGVAIQNSRPYPGVAETLTALRQRGYRTGVATNKPQHATAEVLRGVGLAGLFDGVAGGDRYAVRKPDPGHLWGLIDELGGERTRAAMIGDSENDAAAAHAAGLPLILMRYGYARIDPSELGADRVLDRFGELPEALERLGLIA